MTDVMMHVTTRVYFPGISKKIPGILIIIHCSLWPSHCGIKKVRIYTGHLILRISSSPLWQLGAFLLSEICTEQLDSEAMASQWTINVKVITGQVTRIQALNGPVSW